MSIIYNKNLNPLLNLFINHISTRLTPHIKYECTFVLLNFVITCLCNSSANSLFEISSVLVPPTEVFLSKNLQIIEASTC